MDCTQYLQQTAHQYAVSVLVCSQWTGNLCVVFFKFAGYGQESASRVQRQQIPHQMYRDANGVEHVRVRAPMTSSCRAMINCHGYCC
jgi:hypothetical protein